MCAGEQNVRQIATYQPRRKCLMSNFTFPFAYSLVPFTRHSFVVLFHVFDCQVNIFSFLPLMIDRLLVLFSMLELTDFFLDMPIMDLIFWRLELSFGRFMNE